MLFKKILSLILALLLIFCVVGCKSNEKTTQSDKQNSSQETKSDYITLLYSASDSFNPYTAKTDVNRQICMLLYEPLLKLDNEFNPVYCLADSVAIEGKKCVVSIKNVQFSDGSNVTASDVVYSVNLAKNSQSSYASNLYEVDSVYAEGTNRVIFNLNRYDPYFINLLDFPIIKQGSEKNTDSDGVLQPPVSCGRYIIEQDRESLTLNKNYYGKHGGIEKIKLINAPDIESVAHYVEIGAADIYYSNISDGQIIRMSGKKLDINLNNLVYIGINQNNAVLMQNEIRQALSSAINRKKICQNAYYNNALPATGFFSPVWKEVKAVQNIEIEANSQITIENLEKIGYNRLNNSGIRVNSKGGALSFSLLVNSENRMRVAVASAVASQLKEYGITINVVEKSYEDYLVCLQSGNFQLYIGETMLTANMDFSQLVTPGGNVAFGVLSPVPETAEDENFNLSCDKIVGGFYEGKNTINDIAISLQTQMPLIPICYRTGALFSKENIKNVNNASASDIYFSINQYNVNNNKK